MTSLFADGFLCGVCLSLSVVNLIVGRKGMALINALGAAVWFWAGVAPR